MNKIFSKNNKIDLHTKKLLIFDYDGTIADTNPIHKKAFLQVLDSYNLNFNYDIEQSIIGGVIGYLTIWIIIFLSFTNFKKSSEISLKVSLSLKNSFEKHIKSKKLGS